MKPPVEAPTSRQTRPAGSIPNASSAAASLWPPRLTYGSGCDDRDRDVRRRRGRPACGRSRAASPSPTRTLPARTSAWARLRDSASPRSTSSWSSRMRCGFGPQARGSPAYRGTARCTRTYAVAVGQPAAAPRSGRAWPGASSSVSRTWAARPSASRRRTRRRSVDRAVVDEPVARDARRSGPATSR